MFCIAKKDRWDQEASPTLHQLIGVEVDNRGGMRIPIALAIALLFATETSSFLGCPAWAPAPPLYHARRPASSGMRMIVGGSMISHAVVSLGGAEKVKISPYPTWRQEPSSMFVGRGTRRMVMEGSDGSTPTERGAWRNFVVVCHNVSEAVSQGKFRPNNLLEGRVDVMCRCITNALWVSNGVRKQARIWLVLQPCDVVVGVFGDTIFGLNPDEKTVALFLQRTLEVDAFKLELRREAAEAAEAPKVETEVATFKKGERGWIQKSDRNLAKKQQARRQQAVAHWEFDEGGDPITPPGFAVERDVSLSQLLGRLQGPRLWLHEYGTHVARECEGLAGEGSVVVVGDQIGFTAEEEALLEGWEGVRKISLGATSLLASQCILLTHHYLDGDGGSLR